MENVKDDYREKGGFRKKLKTPKWLQSVLGVILIILEYLLYVHDRIVMSWTAKTLLTLKTWHEIPEKKEHALGRAFVIWGLYGLYRLIF